MLFSRHLLSVFLFVFFGFSAVAQQESGIRDDRFTEIENEKIAYIVKVLKLSHSEAQLFIPIYNLYSKEIWALNSAKVKSINLKESNNASSLRGKDVIEFDAREVEIKKQYRAKFGTIIGVSRASQFFVAEQEFRSMLRQELQKRKEKK